MGFILIVEYHNPGNLYTTTYNYIKLNASSRKKHISPLKHIKIHDKKTFNLSLDLEKQMHDINGSVCGREGGATN